MPIDYFFELTSEGGRISPADREKPCNVETFSLSEVDINESV